MGDGLLDDVRRNGCKEGVGEGGKMDPISEGRRMATPSCTPSVQEVSPARKGGVTGQAQPQREDEGGREGENGVGMRGCKEGVGEVSKERSVGTYSTKDGNDDDEKGRSMPRTDAFNLLKDEGGDEETWQRRNPCKGKRGRERDQREQM